MFFIVHYGTVKPMQVSLVKLVVYLMGIELISSSSVFSFSKVCVVINLTYIRFETNENPLGGLHNNFIKRFYIMIPLYY